MADMNLFVRIGAMVDGSLSRALNGVNNDLNRLDRTAQALTARQQRLGDIMARSLSRPHANIGRLQQQYQRTTNAINQVIQAQERLNNSIRRQQQITGLHSNAGANLVGSVASLTAFALPVAGTIKEAVKFQDRIIDLSITAEWTAKEQARIGDTVRATALQYNQTLDDIGTGLNTLVAGGISSAKEIENYTPKLTQTATAWRASFEDLGNTTVALRNNLGIGDAGWDRAMNMLGYAGKAGQFEVKDMAKWLPSLTPYYQALGVQGEQAVAEIGASLQIARKGAGTSDEAANNMRNFLAKITSPDTIKDFNKAGIDLQKSMQNLVANGMTPMGAMFSTIEQYVGTKSPKALAEFTKAMSIKDDKERQMAVDRLNETYKLGELFQDQQAMSFIRPMMGNKDEFERIKQGSLNSANSNGIGKDYDKRMRSSAEQLKSFKIHITDLAVTIGNALLPAVNQTLISIKPMITAFGNWAKQNPTLVASIIKIVGGLLIAKVAFWGISFAVLSVVKPIFTAVTLFNRLRAGIAILRGMAVLGRFAPMATRFAFAIRMIGTAFTVLRTVLMANPIGIAVGLLIMGAVLIYKHWTPIKSFFANLWASLKAFANSGVSNILRTIASFSPLGLFVRAWSAVFGYFKGLGAKFAGFGRDIIQGLINGVTAKFGELKAKMSAMASSVAGAFKGTLGIRSPSRVFMGFGANIAEGVAIGIDGKTNQAVKASQSMANRLAQTEYSKKVLASKSAGGGGASTIHFSPTISINGGGADVASQVQEGLAMGYREFVAMMERYEKDRNRRAFA